MKILTVRQPWAWAIIHGGKDVENRSRNIAGDYRGLVAIHAGLDRDPHVWGRVEQLAGKRWPEEQDVRGAIIGVVNLWAVHKDGDDGNCCPHRPVGGPGGSPWSERGTWHLCLNDARPLSKPFPYKGALGLRELPDEVAAMVMERSTR